jgi:hypothetical protein
MMSSLGYLVWFVQVKLRFRRLNMREMWRRGLEVGCHRKLQQSGKELGTYVWSFTKLKWLGEWLCLSRSKAAIVVDVV